MVFAILVILSFALQNLCCKEYGLRYPNTLPSQAAMIAVSMAIVTAIMAGLGGAGALPPKGFLLAASFGAIFVMTLASMTLAMHYGHMGITLLIQNASLIIPTIFGIVAWHERLTWVKGIGMVCILLLLFLASSDDSTPSDAQQRKNWNRKLWLGFTFSAFLGDSVLSILQGLMSRECASVSPVCFTFWTSLFSFAVASALFFATCWRGGTSMCGSGRPILPFFFLCAGIGAGTAGGNCFSIAALVRMPGIVLFPLRQGGLVLVMCMLGALIYRERINCRRAAMLLWGIAGMVLINL